MAGRSDHGTTPMDLANLAAVDAVPSVEDFVREAKSFLDEAASPRHPGHTDGPHTDPSLFPHTTSEEQQAESQAARQWRRTVFDAGFGWITGPRQYGGAGLPRDYAVAYHELERGYLIPPPGSLGITLGTVAPTTLVHGSQQAKDAYLRAFHRGDVLACQLFSEPGAGSDLASITTQADAVDEGWRITGQKVWSSHAIVADVGMLLARTSRDSKHGGLTMFLVDMRAPGVDVRPLRQMTGGASFNEVFLTDVVVPDELRLGEVGHGWKVATTTLLHERAFVGETNRMLVFDRLRDLAVTSGRSADPVIRQHLARLHILEQVLTLTNERARARDAAGQPPGPERSVSKLAVASCLDVASALTSRLLGAHLQAAADETFAWAGFVLSVPGVHIAGGTDEIQRNIIAERVLGLPREPLGPG